MKKNLFTKHNAFTIPTIENSYWIGLIMADGCVTYPDKLRITLHNDDAYQLRKFYQFIGDPEHKLYRCGDTCSQVTIYSKTIVRDLIKYGVIPRKSTIDTQIHPDIAKMSSFWLGLLDGDGCITRMRARRLGAFIPCVKFYGAKGVIEQAAIMAGHWGKRQTVQKQGSIYTTKVVGIHAQHLLQYLYSESPAFLYRKKERADIALQWVPKKLGKPKGQWFEVSCGFCGKTILRTAHKLAMRKTHFCSRRCQYARGWKWSHDQQPNSEGVSRANTTILEPTVQSPL